jgi:hypothetical protein
MEGHGMEGGAGVKKPERFDYQAWTWNAAAVAADAAFYSMARNPWGSHFLYCKPGSVLARHENSDPRAEDRAYELVTAQQIPRNISRQGLASWIYEQIKRAPCLPPEEA